MNWMDTALTIGPVLFGLLVKFAPQLKGIPNAAIPYLSFALALVTKLAEVSTTGTASASIAGFGPVAIAGFVGPVIAAGWQAIVNALIYEVFLRHPLALAGLKKP